MSTFCSQICLLGVLAIMSFAKKKQWGTWLPQMLTRLKPASEVQLNVHLSSITAVVQPSALTPSYFLPSASSGASRLPDSYFHFPPLPPLKFSTMCSFCWVMAGSHRSSGGLHWWPVPLDTMGPTGSLLWFWMGELLMCIAIALLFCLLDTLNAIDSLRWRGLYIYISHPLFSFSCAPSLKNAILNGAWPHHTSKLTDVRGWTGIFSPASPRCHLSALDMEPLS
jgi:hypothetical protein